MPVSVRTIEVLATPTLLADGGREVGILNQSHDIWIGGPDVNDNTEGALMAVGQGNQDPTSAGLTLPSSSPVYGVKASGNGATVTVQIFEIARAQEP